jgi:uncharacterized protein (TIGR02118 family)
MYTLLFEVYRKDGISQDEMLDHWLGEHAEIAARLPKVREYQILPVTESAETHEPTPHGFVLMRFDDKDDAEAALGSPEMAAAGEDSQAFAGHFSTFHVDSHKVV